MPPRLVIVAALFVGLARVSSAGPCEKGELSATVLTPAGAAIAYGGGVIVGLVPHGRPVGVDSAVQPRWSFRDGQQRFAPSIRTIAPGLAVYALPPTGNVLELEDERRASQIRVRRAFKYAELAAPKLTKLVHRRVQVGAGSRAFIMTEVAAELAAPPPADAIALLIYAVESSGRVAQSWVGAQLATTHPSSNTTRIPLYRSTHRCETAIPGTIEPRVGQRAVVAWLDVSGRLSAVSNTVAITAQDDF